jgi:hypothetical protein
VNDLAMDMERTTIQHVVEEQHLQLPMTTSNMSHSVVEAMSDYYSALVDMYELKTTMEDKECRLELLETHLLK